MNALQIITYALESLAIIGIGGAGITIFGLIAYKSVKR